ncbi:unnamed protein product [Prorocentrum cordatum]|uniref:Ion transport domain-containing protein n=1 Tax=Prorocentrum cordatum TaxID=2364126 RepID=A0ABN9QRC3_9DINO|nr:unnamed protein product [Polarella glacialis]
MIGFTGVAPTHRILNWSDCEYPAANLLDAGHAPPTAMNIMSPASLPHADVAALREESQALRAQVARLRGDRLRDAAGSRSNYSVVARGAPATASAAGKSFDPGMLPGGAQHEELAAEHPPPKKQDSSFVADLDESSTGDTRPSSVQVEAFSPGAAAGGIFSAFALPGGVFNAGAPPSSQASLGSEARRGRTGDDGGVDGETPTAQTVSGPTFFMALIVLSQRMRLWSSVAVATSFARRPDHSPSRLGAPAEAEVAESVDVSRAMSVAAVQVGQKAGGADRPAGVAGSTWPGSTGRSRIPPSELTRFLQMFGCKTQVLARGKGEAGAYSARRDKTRRSGGGTDKVLEKRGLTGLSVRRVACVMEHIRDRGNSVEEEQPRLEDANLKFSDFVAVMSSSGADEDFGADIAEEVKRWRAAFRTRTIGEVIDQLAREGSPEGVAALRRKSSSAGLGGVLGRMSQQSLMAILHTVVGITVLVGVLSTTLSIDYCVGCSAWLYIEAVVALVFITELLIKLRTFGWNEYFFGDDWKWNWSDTIITLVQVFDVMLTVWIETRESEDADRAQSPGNFWILIRTLRILRHARLVKMFRSPMLNDLSNILSGVLLCLPSMMWVIVMVSVALWLIASGFRSVIGPTDSDELLIEKCGGFDGDVLLNRTLAESIPECAHTWKLYAEEYCPTVASCSFMLFRCMVGDCTSKGGQSLPGHFTSGYGLQFQVIYGFGMLVLMCGISNINHRRLCRVDPERSGHR